MSQGGKATANKFVIHAKSQIWLQKLRLRTMLQALKACIFIWRKLARQPASLTFQQQDWRDTRIVHASIIFSLILLESKLLPRLSRVFQAAALFGGPCLVRSRVQDLLAGHAVCGIHLGHGRLLLRCRPCSGASTEGIRQKGSVVLRPRPTLSRHKPSGLSPRNRIRRELHRRHPSKA